MSKQIIEKTKIKKLQEAISLESELLLKLRPLSESDIFEFMKNLRGGTYFNMGMYASIPVAKAYKPTIRIYKVLDLAAIVSGVSYENVGTTKEFRDQTGATPSSSWYDHMPGFENKVGVKKSDNNSKYVLWDIKQCSDTCVRYYVVDIATGAVEPTTKEDVIASDYLTKTEKNKLMPRPVTGFDLQTGNLVENKTVWRTAAFEHIFWLSQNGQGTKEYGTRFAEALKVSEAIGSDLFRDANAHIRTAKLDDILSGKYDKPIDTEDSVDILENFVDDEASIVITDDTEDVIQEDIFVDKHKDVKTAVLDDILSGKVEESRKMTEAYRRTVSRGKSLADNDLFIDFD